MEERHVKVTFINQKKSSPVTFSEIVNGKDFQALRQSVQAMQTKMNNWLTAEIEKEKSAGEINGVQVENIGEEEIDDDDDADDDVSEPPTKQQKT